jgi:hypothetical protein
MYLPDAEPDVYASPLLAKSHENLPPASICFPPILLFID